MTDLDEFYQDWKRITEFIAGAQITIIMLLLFVLVILLRTT